VRIRTTSGVVLRRFPRQRATTGTFDVAWDGLTDTGATVPSGRYVAEVTAANEIGSVALDTTFAVRRVLPPPPPNAKPEPDARRKK
jgi:flagellar hook assembly protein FlgD